MSETQCASNGELLRRRQAAVPRGPFHVAPIFAARALGARLWDVEGNEYVDFCGGIGAMNVGHNHPRVVAAIQEQAGRFLHTCFHVVMYEPYVRLAERLNELVPVPGPCKTVLFNSGAEAVENAVKASRAHTGRPAVVAFERGFHGRTLLGMTMTGKVHPYKAGFGPFAPAVHRLPWEPFFAGAGRADEDARRSARAALAHLGAYHVDPTSVACLVVEPVLGEGGFHPLHPAAAEVLNAWCADHGVVLVADEIQTGFARCGALFASELVGLRPDVVTTAKSLAGGMVLSGVTGRAAILDAAGVGGIGGTYGGNPVACAAAHAALDVIQEEQLAARAVAIGAVVMTRLRRLQARYDFVAEPRGLGAMCAADIVDPTSGAADPGRAGRVLEEARARGLLIMTASGNAVRFLMPLVITDDELARGLAALDEALAAVAGWSEPSPE